MHLDEPRSLVEASWRQSYDDTLAIHVKLNTIESSRFGIGWHSEPCTLITDN